MLAPTTPIALERCCRSCDRAQRETRLERLLQYLDDLDDLYGALRLVTERLRRVAWFAACCFLLAGLVASGVLLALSEPPLGLAMALLLFLALLYRAVTQPSLEISR